MLGDLKLITKNTSPANAIDLLTPFQKKNFFKNEGSLLESAMGGRLGEVRQKLHGFKILSQAEYDRLLEAEQADAAGFRKNQSYVEPFTRKVRPELENIGENDLVELLEMIRLNKQPSRVLAALVKKAKHINEAAFSMPLKQLEHEAKFGRMPPLDLLTLIEGKKMDKIWARRLLEFSFLALGKGKREELFSSLETGKDSTIQEAKETIWKMISILSAGEVCLKKSETKALRIRELITRVEVILDRLKDLDDVILAPDSGEADDTYKKTKLRTYIDVVVLSARYRDI